MNSPDKHLLAKIGQYILIINNENKVLLLQRNKSKDWSLPGGRLNNDDKDWSNALIREIKEETGLYIRNFEPFDVKLIEDTYQIKYCVYFTAFCPNVNNLKISREHISNKWVSSDEIKEMAIDNEPKVRQVLEHYFTIHSNISDF